VTPRIPHSYYVTVITAITVAITATTAAADFRSTSEILLRRYSAATAAGIAYSDGYVIRVRTYF